MGLYNYVNYPAKCRKCGKEINDWQTKDDKIHDLALIPVPVEDVDEFHDSCFCCGAWNEFQRIDGELFLINCDLEEMQYNQCKECQWHHSFEIEKEIDLKWQFLKPGFHMVCSNMQNRLWFENRPDDYKET